MECRYFGECGACIVYEDGYEAQLEQKVQINKERFSVFYSDEISVFASQDSHYRLRSEFKLWHVEDKLYYGMNHIDKKGVVLIDECPQVNEHISALMPKLLKEISDAVIEAGATTINLPDTVGFRLPSEIGAMVKEMSEYTKNRAIISVHNHNDLGLGWQTR